MTLYVIPFSAFTNFLNPHAIGQFNKLWRDVRIRRRYLVFVQQLAWCLRHFESFMGFVQLATRVACMADVFPFIVSFRHFSKS